jgi:hypothetical protein
VKIMPKQPISDDALLRRWVETWRRAGIELEHIRRVELQSIDTQQAVRHLFDGFVAEPGPPTSGLIEQQAWFARLRDRRKG